MYRVHLTEAQREELRHRSRTPRLPSLTRDRLEMVRLRCRLEHPADRPDTCGSVGRGATSRSSATWLVVLTACRISCHWGSTPPSPPKSSTPSTKKCRRGSKSSSVDQLSGSTVGSCTTAAFSRGTQNRVGLLCGSTPVSAFGCTHPQPEHNASRPALLGQPRNGRAGSSEIGRLDRPRPADCTRNSTVGKHPAPGKPPPMPLGQQPSLGPSSVSTPAAKGQGSLHRSRVLIHRDTWVLTHNHTLQQACPNSASKPSR